MEPNIQKENKQGEKELKVEKKVVMINEQNIDNLSKSMPAQKKQGGFLNLNFKKLDDDFLIPNDDWIREKTLGTGAYGKVMEC